jgi:hypothetical protein
MLCPLALWRSITSCQYCRRGDHKLILHLELLRFKRMLDWIVQEVIAFFHDGSMPYVVRPP